LQALAQVLQTADLESPQIMEVPSGTGQHVSYFAAALPNAIFQPTELERAQLDRCDLLSR
jgi:Rad3-related DNA helicase